MDFLQKSRKSLTFAPSGQTKYEEVYNHVADGFVWPHHSERPEDRSG